MAKMIEVIDRKVLDNGEVWFKVKLQRNTDVLAKELYTKEDVFNLNREELTNFLNWQSDKLINKYYENRNGE